MDKGYFISLEGMDGAGKTTAARLLKEKLEQDGLDVILTREPGGCKISEKIRELLLDPENKDMDPKTEALLYAASRSQHVKDTIRPALAQNKIVLCDRFLDSSLAYQGAARNLGMDVIESINDFGLEGFRPDLTLFFMVDEQTSKERIDTRGNPNRLDQESQDFHHKVRQGFLDLLKKQPDRFAVIQADKTPEENAQAAYEAVCQLIGKK